MLLSFALMGLISGCYHAFSAILRTGKLINLSLFLLLYEADRIPDPLKSNSRYATGRQTYTLREHSIVTAFIKTGQAH